MKAAVYCGARTFRVENLPDPRLEDGEVRLGVEACGLCGTDVRIFKGEHSAYDGVQRRIPGHEIVGRIIQAQSRLPPGLAVGDRVFLAPNIGCGWCDQCVSGRENLCASAAAIGITMDGGFADQVIVPARAVSHGNLIPVSQNLDPNAAVLIEPLACVLRGQDRIGVHVGDKVLVEGAGPVGLLHVALARARGASLVICAEPSLYRREAATVVGATETVDPTSSNLAAVVADATRGAGLDVVIVAAPVHSLQSSAVELAGRRGRVLFFAGLPKSRPLVQLDTNAIHYKELIIAGTTASTVDDCRRASDLIVRGAIPVDLMVSDVVSLDDVDRAVTKAQDTSALKVVVNPRDEVTSQS